MTRFLFRLVSAFGIWSSTVNAQMTMQDLIDLDCPGPGCPSIVWLSSNDLQVGDVSVQLGAFSSFEFAVKEAIEVAKKLPDDYKGSLGFYIQRAQSGDKKFLRLRYGPFSNMESSRRLCAILKTKNEECISLVERKLDETIFTDDIHWNKLSS